MTTRNMVVSKRSIKKIMVNIGVFITELCLSITLLGCSITYKAVGTSSDTDEVLIGTVHHNLEEGSASFTLKAMKSELSCHGIAERPYYIPSSFTCNGQKGRGFGTCSDGRSLKFEWEADTCTLIHGVGKDSLGNSFYFTAGMDDQEEEEYINNLKAGMTEEEARDRIKHERERQEENNNRR